MYLSTSYKRRGKPEENFRFNSLLSYFGEFIWFFMQISFNFIIYIIACSCTTLMKRTHINSYIGELIISLGNPLNLGCTWLIVCVVLFWEVVSVWLESLEWFEISVGLMWDLVLVLERNLEEFYLLNLGGNFILFDIGFWFIFLSLKVTGLCTQKVSESAQANKVTNRNPSKWLTMPRMGPTLI